MDSGQRRLGGLDARTRIDMETPGDGHDQDRGGNRQTGPNVPTRTQRKDSRSSLCPGRGLPGGRDFGPDPVGQVGAGVDRGKRFVHAAGQGTLLVQSLPALGALVHVLGHLGPALQDVLELFLGQVTHRFRPVNPISFAYDSK